jgi:hypothetical protein
MTPPRGTGPPDVLVHIEVICGGITNVKVPVAIGPRYEGLPLAGPAKAFDRQLDSWLTRALDLGMVGSGLGQLFPVNLQRRREAGKSNVDHLLLVGLGEPGHLAPDDLRYLMSNVTVAVKCMWHDHLSMDLIGTRRNELPIEHAARGFLQGILDGYERFRVIADGVTDCKEHYQQAAEQPLFVVLVEGNEEKAKQIQEVFAAIGQEHSIPGLQLEVTRGDNVPPDLVPEPNAVDTEPDVPVTMLRVTRSAAVPPASTPATFPPIAITGTEVFQFSALSETATVTVREVEVNSYLVRELPDRMTNTSSLAEREAFGTFFLNYLLPEDFRKLTEGSSNLTLVVDETTAAYPWEMAAYKKYAKTSFFGTSVGLSRQFRTLLSPPPSSSPPLNRVLKVLIIADPAPGNLSLPKARQEGLTVVGILDHARRAWHGEYTFKVTVRIGHHKNAAELRPILERLRSLGDWIESAEPCDPLKLALLIVNEQFDVIHYAGHGAFDRQAGRAGWVFDRDCFLSAQEIFRVRQVPRLVFANACFSAVTTNANEQRGQLVGLAQAFFARGIPNYIGTGWEVEDACAQKFAQWFYTRVVGLRRPVDGEAIIGTSPPATIGESLLEARRAVFTFQKESSSWGAYQHYGRVCDKLLPLPNARRVLEAETTTNSRSGAEAVPQRSNHQGGNPMTANASVSGAQEVSANPDLIYFNGIDPDTGHYAVPPVSVDALAKEVRARPGGTTLAELRGGSPRAFAMPFDLELTNLQDVGWAVIFSEDASQPVRDALAPLLEHRRKQAGDLLKVFDYQKGEQVRDWYRRHHIAAGTFEATAVPYYLLLVGPPTAIPFEFQYLIGVEYAVGRLDFDKTEDYGQYAASVVAYETARSVRNGKEIVYWGTRHLGDPATNLSASFLLEPLANGVPGTPSALKDPIHVKVGYERKLYSGDDAVRDALLGTLHSDRPPALLFTASHGMALKAGKPNQMTDNGGLLSQDWPGYGSVRREHYLAAADVSDDANVSGLVAFIFACFGGGTPDTDQFLMDLAQAATAPPLAPRPFVAALPRRLLAHPRGSALAVVGHVDRAWSFSIQPAKMTDAQIGPFRNSLGFILDGSPVGHVVAQQFGQRYAALSTALLGAVAPTTPDHMRLSDRDLVTFWLERNDSQNYLMLGDPAVHIRKEALT